MIEILKQGAQHPLARTSGNLRAGLALGVVAMFLSLTVWAKFGMSAQSAVRASNKVIATAPSREQQGAGQALPQYQQRSLSPKAEEVTRIFGFPITNSMIVSWVVALTVIIFAQIATRKREANPARSPKPAGMAG